MYQALYRKWRPKVFSEVVGQEHITDTLRRQAKGRRGARFQTRAAPDAPSRRLLQLHAAAPRLRVVTPAAAQAAPFQEEGRTDARTVVHGHPLNGRDRPFHYFPRPKTKLER